MAAGKPKNEGQKASIGSEKPEQSIKEERIRKIAPFYYSRPDIRKAMFEFSKSRECVPRYFEGFGKRPDSFQYDSDIIELAKNGATSFHCSEELWHDPLEISTELSQEQFSKLRAGWDLLIDVDSKYLDYSKIYAEILIEVLNSVGVKNIGVKFSGSKGWHIIVPWKAFPEEISGQKTSMMFPEWPRRICQYLNSKIGEKLKNRVLDISSAESEKGLLEVYCQKCGNVAAKKSIIFFKCPSCKSEMQNMQDAFARKRIIRCPNCQREMEEMKREEIHLCAVCNIQSSKNSSNFKERVQSKHIDADLVLVSPRHLFRMPYSLHEKTSLVSMVLPATVEAIKNFNPKDADPLKIIPKDFMPNSEPGEASRLLREALEYKPAEAQINLAGAVQSQSSGNKKYADIALKNLNSSYYPPTIKKILEGMKSDGRKRALFILLSFFKSLKIPDEQIIKDIEAWNAKNTEPLKTGYIKSQIVWYSRQRETKLPPNFDKSYYKDIGIQPTPEELASKNPVSYVKRKYFGRFAKKQGAS